jgi:hypothetical protein
MDFNALQHKLFAMDPVDPREDLAKLKAGIAGGAVSDAPKTIDYLQESVDVPEGSLPLDKHYSVSDFAALAGVVNEKKQRDADQVRGNEPMPATSTPSTTGEQPHPMKDRLVGEADEDRITALERRIEALEEMLAATQEEAPPGREKQVKALKKEFPDDEGAPYAIAWAQHNKHGKPNKKQNSSIDASNIKNKLYDALNKKMGLE